jgi:hypothetical protein
MSPGVAPASPDRLERRHRFHDLEVVAQDVFVDVRPSDSGSISA